MVFVKLQRMFSFSLIAFTCLQLSLTATSALADILNDSGTLTNELPALVPQIEVENHAPSVLFWDDLEFVGKKVSKITIVGLKRTQETYIRRLISFGEGDILERGRVDDALDNIRNTRIMKEVTAQGMILPDGNIEIIFQLEEVWTTIPVILFTAGGGSLLILAGFVESNILGYGGQGYLTYQALDGTQTFIGSIKQPDLFQTNYHLQSEFRWEEIKNEFRKFSAERSLFGGFTSQEKSLSASLAKAFEFYNTELPNFARTVSVGIGLRYAKWEATETKLNLEVIQKNRENFYLLPKSTERVSSFLEIALGRVNYNKFAAKGIAVNYRFLTGLSARPNSSNSRLTLQEHLVKIRGFVPLPQSIQFASRFEYQNRISENVLDEEMMGGLFHVRGLPNDIFRGRKVWILNSELRKTALEFSMVHLQAVSFADFGNTSESLTLVNSKGMRLETKPSGIARSMGVGTRIVFPEISELSIRTDYGWLVAPFRASGLSIGLVQFIR
jgi:outer membrane protein assembly factor BamA